MYKRLQWNHGNKKIILYILSSNWLRFLINKDVLQYLPNSVMKNPYITHIVFPKTHLWYRADIRVNGFPKIETEKSEHTMLNNIKFIGVHS